MHFILIEKVHFRLSRNNLTFIDMYFCELPTEKTEKNDKHTLTDILKGKLIFFLSVAHLRLRVSISELIFFFLITNGP